jgi:hypothetical protein
MKTKCKRMEINEQPSNTNAHQTCPLKPTLSDVVVVLAHEAAPRVALVVHVQRYDVVDPVLRQVEEVARGHDHLVAWREGTNTMK